MTATTEYGTWANYASTLSIADTVADFVSGGGDEWNERLRETGAFDRIVDDFRDEINDALPEGVSLAGDQFYGPANVTVDQYDGIRDEIRYAIDEVDLGAIVERHDPDQD